MSQPIHHHQTFLHYTPPGVHHHHHQLHQQPPLNITHVAPKDTQTQSVQGHQQSTTAVVVAAPSTSAQASGPVIAKGDWTKDLVHLAKTAELKWVISFFVFPLNNFLFRSFYISLNVDIGFIFDFLFYFILFCY